MTQVFITLKYVPSLALLRVGSSQLTLVIFLKIHVDVPHLGPHYLPDALKINNKSSWSPNFKHT